MAWIGASAGAVAQVLLAGMIAIRRIHDGDRGGVGQVVVLKAEDSRREAEASSPSFAHQG